jgi:hypothetical protein
MYRISGGRGLVAPVLLPLFFLSLLALPSLLFASESCSMMGGKCRDACGQQERAEAGDFEDCGAKQECCAVYVETPVQCCIGSMDVQNFGPANCWSPVNGACPKGSGSPVTCAKLRMCATVK